MASKCKPVLSPPKPCFSPANRPSKTRNSGDGISQMVKIPEALRAIQAAGFVLEHHEDLAQRPDPIPWYYPLAGDLKYVRSVSDLFTVLRMTRLGRGLVHRLVGGLEMIGLAPQGTQKTADTLAVAADCLVAGGKVGSPQSYPRTWVCGLFALLTMGDRLGGTVHSHVPNDCTEASGVIVS